MWPDRVLNPGPLALESEALPTALRGPAHFPRTSRKLWGNMALGFSFRPSIHPKHMILRKRTCYDISYIDGP